MRGNWAVPVLVSILILGVVSFLAPVYGNLLGDQIDIEIFQNVDVTTNCTQVLVTGAVECTGILEAIGHQSIVTIEVDVGGANGEEVWLTYSIEDPDAIVPPHDIFFSDLDWIDQNTEQPIAGKVTEVICSDNFHGIHVTADDEFELNHPGTGATGLPLEIHCTILTEHELEPEEPEKKSCDALDKASEKGKGKKKGLERARANNNC